MEASASFEDILRHLNASLAPEDRVSEDDIKSTGARLKNMLPGAQSAGQQHQGSGRSWKERLNAFWQAIKEKFSTWLGKLSPAWRKLVNLLRDQIRGLETKSGKDLLIALGLVVVVVATVATLIKSLPLLVALLAILGFATLLRLLQSLVMLRVLVRV